MAFLCCDIMSEVMDMTTSVRVILPDKGRLSETNVVYLLHGRSDNSSNWTRFSSVERYAAEKGLAVVMPEVQRSFYTNMKNGLPYFNYISEELPEICRRIFSFSNKREKNYIMGLSMGGYGALKCALTYPDRYMGVGSFSGVTDISRWIGNSIGTGYDKELAAIFGNDLTVPNEDDLFLLLDEAGNDLPDIYLSCGEQDSLYDDSVRFDSALTKRNFTHRFDHRDGIHDWAFWDRSVKDCFDFFFPA
ncbi:MAG: alpha/beta hydrolase family protein [Candidatus Limivicinus sp.]|nr:alpha/beta hydrolase family protein [Candidatus Limivicinus sp.]